MLNLTQIATHSVEIKKSRFIATCAPIQSIAQAEDFIKTWHRPDATHNCWAWRLGSVYRFNDDGEPASSAGKPMLSAIDALQFDCTLAHIVRYFGGIKLGVGGLVRAYSNTVKQTLQKAESVEFIPTQALQFLVDFADTYAVYGIINGRSIPKLHEQYTPNGIEFCLQTPLDQVQSLRQALQNATQARIVWLDKD